MLFLLFREAATSFIQATHGLGRAGDHLRGGNHTILKNGRKRKLHVDGTLAPYACVQIGGSRQPCFAGRLLQFGPIAGPSEQRAKCMPVPARLSNPAFPAPSALFYLFRFPAALRKARAQSKSTRVCFVRTGLARLEAARSWTAHLSRGCGVHPWDWRYESA